MRFRTFSPKGGFYYDGVLDIAQDKKGFIWVMLDNAVQRFDGYEYMDYSSQLSGPDNNESYSFKHFATGPDGDIYILTDHSIFRYDVPTDRFHKIMDGDFNLFAIDAKGDILLTKNSTLHRLPAGSNEPETVLHNGKPVKNIGNFTRLDSAGRLYFSSGKNCIYIRHSGQKEEVEIFHLFPDNHGIVGLSASSDKLWVLTKAHGLYRLDKATGRIDGRFDIGENNETTTVREFLVDKNGMIWLGTQHGLRLLDPEKNSNVIFRHSKSNPFSLPNNSVWKLFSDSHNNIWMSHYAGILSYADLEGISNVRTFNTMTSLLTSDLISSFAEDENHFYIGTEGGGLNCLDKKTGEITHQINKKDNGGLSSDNVKSLIADSRNRLWIAMYRGGLDCLDLNSGQFRRFRHDASDPASLYNDNLRKIILDADTGLWIAYQSPKALISHLSFASGKFNHFNCGDGGYIFDIQRDRHGNLYMLTRRSLYRLNASTRKVEEVSKSKITNGQALTIDRDGNIWIGTIGFGLIKQSPSNGSIVNMPDLLKPHTSTVYSICNDSASNALWIGTNNGLFHFDLNTNFVRRFDDNDGFQGPVYYPLAVFRSHSGNILVGGTSGFTIFDPGSIAKNNIKPKARISHFYIENKPVSASTLENQEHVIELDYDQDNFGFAFSSDNYQSPEKTIFKYRLKGYDDNWIVTDASHRTAMYAKVPAGKYKFEVFAANSDKVWGDEPTVIDIVKHPAPWASPLAYVVYLLVFVAVGMVVYHYWKEKRRLKMQLYMDKLDKQNKENLHQSRLRFFTNISHDFRTPLSLILAAVDSLKQENMKEYNYQVLKKNARRLLNLVNELMDFRTLENNKMALHTESVDINGFVTAISSDFKEYARKHNIDYSIKCDTELTDAVPLDKRVIEKVVMNLLNNSFKYTENGGSIEIATYSDASKFKPEHKHSYHVNEAPETDREILLVVKDTGAGISADSISSIFDRYYQVNTSNLNKHIGTGIGLALVKSLVTLHKGRISVYSERDKGTEIAVALPADFSVYSSSELRESHTDDTYTRSAETELQLKLLYDNDTTNSSLTPETESESDETRKKILLVEDNDDLRIHFSRFLGTKFDMLQASDGVEAEELIRQNSIDMIISDIMMPRKDGITLCREMKADVDTSHIPFILLTARSGPDDRLEGADAGAELYFSKPIDFNLLMTSINNIFRRQKNLREHYARHYYADSSELSSNRQDADFLKKVTTVIDAHLQNNDINVNLIAEEMCMSRSKLYSKLKALTGKSIVEFVLNYRMRKAARLLVEQNLLIYQVMDQVGIRSQSYFVNAFKKEFGETPSAFINKNKSPNRPDNAE